jgi:hypothetical protein
MLKQSRPTLKVPMTPEQMSLLRTMAIEQGTTVEAIVHKALASLVRAWKDTPAKRQARLKAELVRATRLRVVETTTGLKKIATVESAEQARRAAVSAGIVTKTGKLSARYR